MKNNRKTLTRHKKANSPILKMSCWCNIHKVSTRARSQTTIHETQPAPPPLPTSGMQHLTVMVNQHKQHLQLKAFLRLTTLTVALKKGYQAMIQLLMVQGQTTQKT
ncbi:hypothetical protein TcCL_NonESM08795, partial [Trypanosoma cruzi]